MSKPLIQLFTKVDSGGTLENAISEITWCITDELTSMLNTGDYPNPHLVLLVEADNRLITTKTVPLEQSSTYIEFFRGGENTIHAILASGWNVRKIKKDISKTDFWSDWEYHKYINCATGEVVITNTKSLDELPGMAEHNIERDNFSERRSEVIEARSELQEVQHKALDRLERELRDQYKVHYFDDIAELPDVKEQIDKMLQVHEAEQESWPQFEPHPEPPYRRTQGYVGGIDGDLFNITSREYRDDLVQLNANLVVNVSTELFAKELNPTLKYFINLWHENKLTDQCHMRQRVMILLFLKSWPIIAWTLIKTVSMFATAVFFFSVGFRDVNFKAILHPWDLPLKSVFFNCEPDNNYLAVRENDPWYYYLRWYFTPFIWLILLPVFTIVGWSITDASFIEVLIVAIKLLHAIFLTIVGALIVVFGLILLHTEVLSKIDWIAKALEVLCWVPDKIVDYLYRDMDSPEERAKVLEKQRQLQRDMICPANGDYVPPERFSFKLWFERVKSKVCKPFPH